MKRKGEMKQNEINRKGDIVRKQYEQDKDLKRCE